MLLAMSTSEEKVNQPYKNIDNIATDNFTQLNEMRERISILEKELNESKGKMNTLISHIMVYWLYNSSIFYAEQVKDLETQKQTLVQINENLHKTIKELEISLEDANIAFSNMKKDLEEAKELNKRYKEETVVLENKMLKLSEECSTTEQVASSKEVNEVRLFIYCSYAILFLYILIFMIVFLRIIIKTRKSNI